MIQEKKEPNESIRRGDNLKKILIMITLVVIPVYLKSRDCFSLESIDHRFKPHVLNLLAGICSPLVALPTPEHQF